MLRLVRCTAGLEASELTGVEHDQPATREVRLSNVNAACAQPCSVTVRCAALAAQRLLSNPEDVLALKQGVGRACDVSGDTACADCYRRTRFKRLYRLHPSNCAMVSRCAVGMYALAVLAPQTCAVQHQAAAPLL